MKLRGLPTTKRFSFALKCIQDLHFPIHFGQFGPVSTQPHQNGRAWCKSYGHLRAKLKHVLWLGDLKASLSNSIEKFIYKTSSSVDFCFLQTIFSVKKSTEKLILNLWRSLNIMHYIFQFQKPQCVDTIVQLLSLEQLVRRRDPIGSSLVGSRTDGPQQAGSLEGTLTTYLVHGSDLGFGRPQHFYGEGRSLAAAAASGAALIAVTWLPAAYSLT